MSRFVLAFVLMFLQDTPPANNQHLTDDQLMQIELRADLTKCQVVLERQNRIVDALQNEVARLRKIVEERSPKPAEIPKEKEEK